MVFLARGDELHEIVGAYPAVDNLEVCDDAAEGIEHGVENQGLKRRFGVTLGRGNTLHDGAQDLVDAHAGLAARADYLRAVASQQIHYLVLDLVGLGALQIALVDHRNDLQVIVYGHVQIGDGLRLDALRRVHNQQRTLAGRDTARHLVGKVHMPRSVDQIQIVMLAILIVIHLDGVALDRNAPFAFQIHVVEHLSLHVLGVYRARAFQQSVGKRALAMVDMCDDAEIAYILHCLFSCIKMQN